VDEEASKLLTIVTNSGRYSYKVLPQGVCNSSALWNILTDGDARLNSNLAILEQKLITFMEFARSKNLKLDPKKFFVSEEVEFGGSTVTAEKCADESLIFISPKNKRIRTFEELRKPRTIIIFKGLFQI